MVLSCWVRPKVEFVVKAKKANIPADASTMIELEFEFETPAKRRKGCSFIRKLLDRRPEIGRM